MFNPTVPIRPSFLEAQDLMSTTRNRDAQTAYTQALAAAKQQEVLAAQDAMKRRASFMEFVRGQNPAAAASTEMPVVEETAVVEEGKPKRPAFMPDASVSTREAAIKKQFADAERNDALAQAAEKAGLLDEASKYRDDARVARDQAINNQEQLDEVELKAWQRAYDMASAVTDEASFQTTMAQLNRMQPGAPEEIGFIRLPDGSYLWDKDTPQKIKQIADFALSQKERLEFRNKAIELDLRAKELERRQEKDQEIERYRDEIIALRRDGMDERANALQARLEAQQARLDLSQARLIEQKTAHIQTVMDKNEAVKNFPKYQQAYEQAVSAREVLERDPNSEKLNAVSIDVLRRTYTNASGAFRQRPGGKWEDENVREFNGAFQKMEKYFATIGRGTPVVNRANALKMIEEIDNMYHIAAAEALKAELSARRAARARGADVNALQHRAYGDENLVRQLSARGLLKVTKKEPVTNLPIEIKIGGKVFNVAKEREAASAEE